MFKKGICLTEMKLGTMLFDFKFYGTSKNHKTFIQLLKNLRNFKLETSLRRRSPSCPPLASILYSSKFLYKTYISKVIAKFHFGKDEKKKIGVYALYKFLKCNNYINPDKTVLGLMPIR